VLTARDRFVGIQGLAGTGKSHMLSKAVAAIKAETCRLSGKHGYRVIGLAPYASQNEALASLGMESQTLASFLARTSQQRTLNQHSIVFLDEAGDVPAHQLEKLMSIIEKQDARLILSGDRKQTHAVEAGKPFEQLQDAWITKAFLTEIKRQENEAIRAAVVHAANDEVPRAVAVLHHTIGEVRQDAQRHARLAQAYVQLPEAERSETLIVAGTNEARRVRLGRFRIAHFRMRGQPIRRCGIGALIRLGRMVTQHAVDEPHESQRVPRRERQVRTLAAEAGGLEGLQIAHVE
jgi:ATP-dependent exoDNAse (exonuclease V) alpha subunit